MLAQIKKEISEKRPAYFSLLYPMIYLQYHKLLEPSEDFQSALQCNSFGSVHHGFFSQNCSIF